MKITFLLTQDLESPSGIGRYWPLAYELANLGHNIEILALHPNIESLENMRFREKDVDVHYVAPMHVKKLNSDKSYYPAHKLSKIVINSTWQLTKSTFSSQSDIVHIGKPHPMNSIAGLAARYLRGKQLYLDCDDYEGASGHFNAQWQKMGVSFFEKQIPLHVKMVTTNTFFMHRKLQLWGVPSEKILYLPNGVDRKRFQLLAPELIQELRATLGLEGKKVVSYIGSMSLASHAVDILIEAFAHVHAEFPQAILLLVGGGEDLPRLKTLARATGLNNAVMFCGRVPPEKVSLYYQLSCVTVDPVYDNDAARGRCPLKLFESWACGVPFITADVGDRSRLLGNPPAGLLVQPGDPISLKNIILQVLTTTEQAEMLFRLGLERVTPYYWDILVHRLDDKYYSTFSDSI